MKKNDEVSNWWVYGLLLVVLVGTLVFFYHDHKKGSCFTSLATNLCQDRGAELFDSDMTSFKCIDGITREVKEYYFLEREKEKC